MVKINSVGVDVIAMADKYLSSNEGKVSNTNAFSEVSSLKVPIRKNSKTREYALIKLRNGQTIKIEEETLLYEKVKSYALSNFLMFSLEKYINPLEISEFIDIDRDIDYSTKDI